MAQKQKPGWHSQLMGAINANISNNVVKTPPQITHRAPQRGTQPPSLSNSINLSSPVIKPLLLIVVCNSNAQERHEFIELVRKTPALANSHIVNNVFECSAFGLALETAVSTEKALSIIDATIYRRTQPLQEDFVAISKMDLARKTMIIFVDREDYTSTGAIKVITPTECGFAIL
jgi:hypothetical protein